MVKWVIDHMNISTINFMNKEKIFIGSFTKNDLRSIYHLPQPQQKYNNIFIKKFMKENQHQLDSIKNQRRDHNKHKREDKCMYSIASLVGPYYQIATMICRIYGYPNT